MKILPFFLIFLIIFSSFVTISDGRGISVDIYGPTIVGTNGTYQYKIVVNGYFDEYGYHLFLTGENMSGGTTNELVGNSYYSNVFIVNLTFPSQPQTVYIYVMGIGIVNGSSPVTTTNYLQVNVVKSIPINLKIKNTAPYEIKNINVTFYLNGKIIGNSTISSIGPNSTTNVTYYYVGTFENGVNVIYARLNSNVVKFSNGSNVTSINFYYGTPPNYTWLWYLLIGIVLFSIAILFFYTSAKKRPNLPKWKK